MRRVLDAIPGLSILGAVLLLALALAGCAGTGSGSATESTVVVRLSSAALAGGEIPARYTCDGANIAPELRWGTVPSTVSEVVLFALGMGSFPLNHVVSSVEWAMAGVNPQLHGLAAGELPPGAFLVPASDGKRRYSICPPKGQTREYEFALYAMPAHVAVGRGIDGLGLFGNLAQGPPGDRSPAVGELFAKYSRK
jgi:phosphatidylethanolamine-binding protein (PEBP) family uncharacterized protein